MGKNIGRFGIVRELGRGAQSVVYLARDPRRDDGPRQRTTHCIVVFVAVGDDGKALPIPAYHPQTDEERELQDYAKRLMELRQIIETEQRTFLAKRK